MFGQKPVTNSSDWQKQDTGFWCMIMISTACLLQLSFPDCVPLKPSSSGLQDKREYHAMVLGDSHPGKHGSHATAPNKVVKKSQ